MTVIFLTIRGEEKELENSLIHNAKLSNKIAKVCSKLFAIQNNPTK